jgi:hypothetical protein
MIAKTVLDKAQTLGLGADLKARFKQSLIARIPRTEHHAVLAKGNRLAVPVDCDVSNGQDPHASSMPPEQA